MKITIHRGTHEIGGCATEIRTEKARVIVDLGAALDGAEPVLIDGVNSGETSCDGILFTHYHADHIGEMNTVLPGIPMFCGETAKLIMQRQNAETKQFSDDALNNMNTFTQGRSFTIGDMKITPFSVDHSAYDAYMFLIEAEGKRVLHTGDFRMHGYRGKGVEKVLKALVGKVDALICEGTTINGDHETALTEPQLSAEIHAYLKDNKYVFAVCSSTNFDRLAGIYNAIPDGRYRLCDSYQLDQIKIMREQTCKYTTLYKFEKMLTYGANLSQKMRDRGFCMFVRLGNPFHRRIMESFADLQPKVLFSMWKGYLDEPGSAAFLEGFTVDKKHTSGHADIAAISRVITLTDPDKVIPIHTESPEKFEDLAGGRKVLSVSDGETVEI